MEGTEKAVDQKLTYDAKIYSVFRRNSPDEIISKIMSHLKEKYNGPLNIAVDVGCGSGQGTVVFAPFFKTVYGIDSLETQIEEAKKSRMLSNIIYSTGPSETLPFEDGSVQLITAATSLHWFNLDLFLPEAKRILCNNGILAVYACCSLKAILLDPENNVEMDKLYDQYYEDLNSYFNPQFKILVQRYDINFPFEEVIREPDVRCCFEGKLSDVAGYAKSFSALITCREQNSAKADEIIQRFEKRLYDIAAFQNISPEDNVTLYRDFILIICRKVV